MKTYQEIEYKVAGISFQEDVIIKQLAEENDDYQMTKKEFIEEDLEDERVYKYDFPYSTAELVPEPDNEYDPNAVAVKVDGVRIGYVPKGKAKAVKKLIADPLYMETRVEINGGPYKLLKSEWDDDKDKDVYELIKDEAPLFARITVCMKYSEEYLAQLQAEEAQKKAAAAQQQAAPAPKQAVVAPVQRQPEPPKKKGLFGLFRKK